ncbi:hypothetical protein JR316_0009223 [Psilocybe cubensis]|uniref:Uncharacterized protein n=2 Tax=Psilocybe cubensis TaxID=181762 RepID=A0ACB8GTK5_PSICU|nr:hypothetical protein JR316_0009223 [Psilocybe cubensis]KAH9478762.1 hypothetical protein JR316_0009223 [Psilocybe cubensis]
MIHKVGLLPLSHIDKVWDAYGSWVHSTAFRKDTGSRTVIIEFVGVWDTVNSVGLIGVRKLYHTASNGSLRTFRHAVALDEHRARFRSNMWSPPSTYPKKRPQHFVVTDVDQVRFSGCHCDVGGGSVPNGTRPNLAHIALRWMVRECFKAKTGLRFDPAEIMAIGIDPDSLNPVVKPRPPPAALSNSHRISTELILQPSYISKAASWLISWFKSGQISGTPDYSIYNTYGEEELDLVDALAPVYDQLVINRRLWWFLEHIWLRRYSVTNKKMVWNRNLERGRMIPVPHDSSLTDPSAAASLGQVAIHPGWSKIRVHRTVTTRMESSGDIDGRQYIPRALLKNTRTLNNVDPSLIE